MSQSVTIEEAARLLLGRLSGENGAERLDVGFTVIPGQSTRKPT